VIAGYWTHSGYLNLDTGLGFERWHQSKKVGLSAQGLIGLAASDSLGLEPRYRRWAKEILDRGLELFERHSLRAGGVPPALFFGVDKVPQTPASARLGAARIEANASWSLRQRGGARAYTVRVMFPTYGRGARVEALLRTGRRVALGSQPVAVSKVRTFLMRSERTGYDVTPLRRAAGAVARAVPVRAQSSAPRAGRSLVVRVARGRVSAARFAARVTVRPTLAVR
jgi:hypothetical protein